jgi:AAA domain
MDAPRNESYQTNAPDNICDLSREAVCEAVPIETVARKYAPLLERFGGGGWYMGACPFEDKNQFLYITPEGTWECQGCDRGRDVVDLEFFSGNYASPSEAMLALAIEHDVELPQGRRGHHSSSLKFRTAKEVAGVTPREVPWKARPWAAGGAITEIDGKIKRAGKTTFAFHMVGCILDGKPFMGEPTEKSKVVCLTEQSPTSFRKVLERAGLTDTEDLLVLHWHDTIGLEWPEVAKAAADKAVEFGAEVLVVDTLLGQFAGIRGDSENSSGAAQEVMQPLQEAAARGLAVVITRHERKGGGEVGESARGSSAFGGAVDIISCPCAATRARHAPPCVLSSL